MAPPRFHRLSCTCPVCGAPYEALPSSLQRGKQTTCSRPCSYALRMKTRRNPADKRRKSAEHKRAKRRLKHARYREKYRAILNAKQRAYIAAHPEEHSARCHKRRARLLGCAVNDLSAQDWREIKAEWDHTCAYCGQRPPLLTRDHIVPVSRGGNNTRCNVVPACKSCNSRKHVASRPLLPKPVIQAP